MEKTKENKFQKKQSVKKWVRGFTLLELLIAISIFAAAVVMLVGAFGISTKNQRQIRIGRDISQNVRYAVSEMSRQIEMSSYDTLRSRGGVVIQAGDSVRNFAILASEGQASAVPDMSNGSVLLVRDSEDHCRYYTSLPDSHYRDQDGNSIHRLAVFVQQDPECKSNRFDGPFFLTDEKTDITNLQFHGVMNTEDKTQQAFVIIKIDSVSTNPEYSLPFQTRTTVALRNFGR